MICPHCKQDVKPVLSGGQIFCLFIFLACPPMFIILLIAMRRKKCPVCGKNVYDIPPTYEQVLQEQLKIWQKEIEKDQKRREKEENKKKRNK